MSDAPIPVEGWVTATASYEMKIRRAIVAFVRDNGPADRDRVLTAIIRAGIGADVKKASPGFDELDGATRILNFAVTDIDVLHVDDDGSYTVAPDVRQFRSAYNGDIVDVPSADDLIANRDRGRRKTQLRAWLRNRVFHGEWAKEIRPWSDADVMKMVRSIDARGYFGWPMVRDQDGVLIDGHLRYEALVWLGIDPDKHTTTRVFDGDLDRLAWIMNVHSQPASPQGHGFPASLRAAIIKMVEHGRPYKASKEGWPSVSWPEDIDLMLGDDRRDLGDDTDGAPMPPVPTPQSAVAPVEQLPPPPVEGPPSAVLPDVSAGDAQAAWLFLEGPLSDHQATVAAKTTYNKMSARITRCHNHGLMRVVGKHGDGSRISELTDAGRARVKRWLDNHEWRPAPGPRTDVPGATIRDSSPATPRLGLIRQLVNLERAKPGDGWMMRPEMVKIAGSNWFSLRRMMWFQHVDRRYYVVIPETYLAGWERMRLRELTHIELSDLRACKNDYEATCERWERLVAAEAILSP